LRYKTTAVHFIQQLQSLHRGETDAELGHSWGGSSRFHLYECVSTIEQKLEYRKWHTRRSIPWSKTWQFVLPDCAENCGSSGL
jgi:hypothetical protein